MALQRQPVRGSLTSSVPGDLVASATTLKFMPPIAIVVVKTLGEVIVMVRVMPPAVRRVAVSPLRAQETKEVRIVQQFAMTVTGKAQKFEMRKTMEAELGLVA